MLPGFTFSRKPGWRDVPLGMIAVLLVTCVTALAWRGLLRSRGIQHAALAAALAWLVFALVAVWHAPDNTNWNRGWREVVRGQSLHAPAIPFPRGVDDAASFVLAVRAYAAGRVEEGDGFLARVKEREYFRLDRASVLEVASEARGAR